jgi:hypothetical protein
VQDLNNSWSLGDAVADLLFMLGVARALWGLSSYYGEAQLAVTLNLQNLSMHTALVSDTWSHLGPIASREIHEFNAVLGDSIVFAHPQSSATANATGVFNSGLPFDAAPGMVADVVNQLLRSLKHSADLNRLRDAVESFLRATR